MRVPGTGAGGIESKADALAYLDTLEDLRGRHALDLRNKLYAKGHAAGGVRGFFRVLSVMCSEAVVLDLMPANPFRGVEIRASDKRVQKRPRARRAPSWADAHAIAENLARAFAIGPMIYGDASGHGGRGRIVGKESTWFDYRAMGYTLTDTGMRIGEILPLTREDFNGTVLHVLKNIDNRGRIQAGTKNDHGEDEAGRDVPVSERLAELLREMPTPITAKPTDLLFPTPMGKMWNRSNFARDLWRPARIAAGLDYTPHECRHGFATNMLAAGLPVTEIAMLLGNSVGTAMKHYVHGTAEQHEAVRKVLRGAE